MYIDYAWYSANGGKVPESQFPAYNARAERTVDSLTHNRARTATGYKLEQVKWAVLAAMDAQYTADQTGVSDGVVSASNDGYSESYAAKGQADVDKAIEGSIRRELSGTGLMGAI